MKELFPLKQIIGFVFSLVLTAIALMLYFVEGISNSAILTILIVTASIQAILQLVVFMHAGETKDKFYIYGNVLFMVFVALVTIFGTLFLFVWDM